MDDDDEENDGDVHSDELDFDGDGAAVDAPPVAVAVPCWPDVLLPLLHAL